MSNHRTPFYFVPRHVWACLDILRFQENYYFPSFLVYRWALVRCSLRAHDPPFFFFLGVSDGLREWDYPNSLNSRTFSGPILVVFETLRTATWPGDLHSPHKRHWRLSDAGPGIAPSSTGGSRESVRKSAPRRLNGRRCSLAVLARNRALTVTRLLLSVLHRARLFTRCHEHTQTAQPKTGRLLRWQPVLYLAQTLPVRTKTWEGTTNS